jgi:hypothetical protein
MNEQELCALIHQYITAEISRLMHQAEHWASDEHRVPMAVLHRLHKADADLSRVKAERDGLRALLAKIRDDWRSLKRHCDISTKQFSSISAEGHIERMDGFTATVPEQSLTANME